ncbi:squalene synthase HpnC [Leeia sp. TBRC 13508]|uniref:Squalene synthase HpnC n=1 Tax=Leeia speluncae TaxID=2884804 RepID=A0ABS8DAM9_9NEIS|nr:squalene synthase HpnC [Leeia speluncae]MCB6185265.1 squalene synthase HpnC [Leeia speluncae]
MPVDHYENFPVASIVLPKKLRRPVEVIYHFARSADDFADEGDHDNETRLAWLNNYSEELDKIEQNLASNDPLFIELGKVIKEFGLPVSLFQDLLSAFKQDVVKKEYDTFGELIQYCRRSANPVGRLMLYLFGEATPTNLAMSDGICSALQLINFWQDIAIDWQKNRVYIPNEDLVRFGVSKQQIENQVLDYRWKNLIQFEVERTQKMLEAGSPLGIRLSGRFGLEVRMIVLGGERILKKIWEVDGDVYNRRPTLKLQDWLYIVSRGVFPRLFKS